MATRCSIRVEGVDYVEVYKHWDGYPEHMLPWLKDFHQRFLENRGFDPDYEIAQLLRDSVRNAKKFDLDDSESTGWGLMPFDSDAGQDYIYTLNRDGSVSVKSQFH